MTWLAFMFFRVLGPLVFLGLNPDPSRSPKASSFGLEGIPKRKKEEKNVTLAF